LYVCSNYSCYFVTSLFLENDKIKIIYQKPNDVFWLIYKFNNVAMRILSTIPAIVELLRDNAENELSDDKLKSKGIFFKHML
jgi:amino acid permease